MKKLKLNNWTLRGDKIALFPVCVPGDVTDELYKAGLIEDPLFGQNAENTKWIAEKDWTYESVFDVPQEILSKERIRLCFDGIDTLSEISLNGVKLGETDNMFLRYAFDVRSLLKSEGNVLTVKILSATKYIREKNDGGNYRALFTQDRIWIRKAQCHWGWDWAPNLPGIGIWLPVYIEADDGQIIDNVKVDTYLTGDVRFAVTLHNKGSHLFQNENKEFTLRLMVGDIQKEVPVSATIEILNVKIEKPKLWFPSGYGEQNLYGYTVELLKNGEVVSVKKGKFGIREIKLDESPIGDNRSAFALIVNGRKIFAKGSNWVPCSPMTGTIEKETYRKLLTAAKESNFNILRVWGGGIYEKEEFYELCDELGIMVWQDFMFACSAVPAMLEGIEENFLREAEYQIKRLRNHPSIALWCGGNEYMPHIAGKYYETGNYLVRVILRGLCSELDRGRIYIHNSPYGLDDDEWRLMTGDGHVSCMDEAINRNDFDGYRKYIAHNPTQFASESAHLGPTRLRSLRKFIPEEEIRAIGGETWEYHFVKNPYAPSGETFLLKEKKYAEGFFGKFDCVEDFVKKAMLAHAELLTSEIEFARSNSNCRGFMNWMYNDIWGCGTWSVIDCYFEKKPAMYAMKRAFAPVYICFTQDNDGTYINLLNDTEEIVSGKVVCRAKTLDGELVAEASGTLRAEKDGGDRFLMDLKGGDYWTAEVSLKNGKQLKTIYFPSLWKDKNFESELQYEIIKLSEKECEIKIKADKFARTVFIDTSDNVGVEYSDNFFDMEKGDEITVTIKSERPLCAEDVTVKTFADQWSE